jgi:hypothetical protein
MKGKWKEETTDLDECLKNGLRHSRGEAGPNRTTTQVGRSSALAQRVREREQVFDGDEGGADANQNKWQLKYRTNCLILAGCPCLPR